MNDEVKAPENQGQENQEAPNPSDHIQKLLKEKQNWQSKSRTLEEENAIIKAKLKEKEELELINQKKYQEVAEIKKKEADEWKQKYEQTEQRIVTATKASAVKAELLKMGLNPQYAAEMIKLADLNSLHYDDESRVVTGTEEVAKSLYEKFPPLFGKGKPGVSHDAPQGGGGRLTMQEWKALPREEQLKREPELYATLGISRTK